MMPCFAYGAVSSPGPFHAATTSGRVCACTLAWNFCASMSGDSSVSFTVTPVCCLYWSAIVCSSASRSVR